jgi:hypothetical protein
MVYPKTLLALLGEVVTGASYCGSIPSPLEFVSKFLLSSIILIFDYIIS